MPGNKVVYLENEDYVPRKEPPSAAAGGKIAKVDRVAWHYIPEPSTRAIEGQMTNDPPIWRPRSAA